VENVSTSPPRQALQDNHRAAALGAGPVEVDGCRVEQLSSSPGGSSDAAGKSVGRPGTGNKEAREPRGVGEPESRSGGYARSRGKYVEQEAAQEFLDRQGHQALLVAVCGVSPAKR